MKVKILVACSALLMLCCAIAGPIQMLSGPVHILTEDGGGGGGALPNFTPELGFTVNATDSNQYTAIQILDSSNRLGTRANAKAYQVYTFESGNMPDATYSRDTTSAAVDGSRVTTTTAGIAVPVNNTGMLVTQNLGTPSTVAGPEVSWSGSGAQKTMGITEEYIGWNMTGDINVTNVKIFRWDNFGTNKSYYSGIGSEGFGCNIGACMSSDGHNISSVEGTGPSTIVWDQTGEYPKDRQQNWNVWQQFMTESSANGVGDGSNLAYFNGVLWTDKSRIAYTALITKDSGHTGNYVELTLGYQFSNSGGISSSHGIAIAFALFDTEHGGIAFWSPESSINTTTWSEGSDTATRAYFIPNGASPGEANMFQRRGQFSSLSNLYLWYLTPSLTFIRVGRMGADLDAAVPHMFLPSDAANADYFEQRIAA